MSDPSLSWFTVPYRVVVVGQGICLTSTIPLLIITHRRDHDDVIKWKHFPRYWPFVRGIHRSPVNFPHRGQWRRALMLSLICVWINGWGWWFETPSRPLWRHRNAMSMLCKPKSGVFRFQNISKWKFDRDTDTEWRIITVDQIPTC